jgi:VWFA-related protein
VVLFDRLNTRSENQNYAELELLKFLKKTRSLERVAVYVLDSRLRVLVDFTGDRDLLARSLRRVSGDTSSQLEASEPAKPEAMTDRFKWVEREIGRTDRSIATLATQTRAQNTLRALEAIGHHLSSLPGRKSLVWISDAFPLTMGVDAGDLLARAGRGEDRGLPATPAMNLSPQIARAARVLTDANVAVYPVEARGLAGVTGANAAASAPTGPELDTSLPGSVLRAWRSMEALAEDTGGRAFRGSNDIGESMRQALDDGGSVYVLAYSPAHNEWNGKFRRIKVRVKREGLMLRYRRGYLAASAEEETGEQLDRVLLAASASPLEATGIDLTAGLTRPLPPEGRQWKVSLTIDTRNISLQTADAHWLGALDLLFVQRASDSTELSVIKAELPIRWDQPSYESHAQDGIRVNRLLDLLPAATQLRIVVRDRRSGKLGSLNIPL